MGTPLRLLIVDDSLDDTTLLLRELRQGGFDPMWERVETATAMGTALDRQPWDLVIADFTMPEFNGAEALSLLRARDADLPFIFASGTIGEELAVGAMKTGANDYIVKGNLGRLVPAVERELREADVRRENRRMAARLQYLAYYDVLTDLPNRALLHDRLLQGLAAAQREKKSLALILLDLDGFKEVNDTLGHSAGDVLLQQVGRRIQHVLREQDTVARLDGDEFLVLLPGSNAQVVHVVTQRLLATIGDPFHTETLQFDVRASLGIALYPTDGTTPDVLMHRADVAMHYAKKTGTGVATYSPEIDRESLRSLAPGEEIRRAIQTRHFVMHYQPKVRLHDRRVLGLELLARWQHPRHGLLAPARFIGLAEQSGQIRPLTLAAIDSALQACQRWREEDRGTVVAVNLSPRALEDERFPDEVAMLVRASGLAPPCLDLEITENLVIADPRRALATFARWSQLGIRLSIDDFGTGYSSMASLKMLPVHEVKIDASFLTDLAQPDDEMIVQSMIGLAHGLGMTVVAEGVETRATWDRLAALGCDAAQGFYISPPAPFDEMTAWLRRWREAPRPHLFGGGIPHGETPPGSFTLESAHERPKA